MQTCLYSGEVLHHRFAPRVHRLNYRVFQILFDLDQLAETLKPLKLLSLNRFNWLGFNERDHGPVKGDTALPLRERMIAFLTPLDIYDANDRLFLLAMPRVLGFVFNPISLYFVVRPDDGIRGIVYQVNNTFGERHCYVLKVDQAGSEPMTHGVSKRLHVSPFMDMDMQYRFDITAPDKTFALRILVEQLNGAALQRMLLAVFKGERKPLKDKVLRDHLLAMPFMTLKVVWGIHWEALKIFLKGIKYRPGPKTPPDVHSIGVRLDP
jgi:uncharacterized protein